MDAAKLGLTAQPAATLTVINPSGHRSQVLIGQTPFHIGRQADNQLALRDNRVSRVHARIVSDQAEYFIEDLNSRHGVWVNGERIAARRQLHPGDLVTFGFDDGYQLEFHEEAREIGRLAEQVASSSKTAGSGNLAKLRALVEVARALQSSLSIREVLDAVVDAALTVTGAQRGFLLLRHGAELRVEVARDSGGADLRPDELRVPTQVIDKALRSRRELLSMHFDNSPGAALDPNSSVAQLDLRSVVCIPLVKIRTEIATHTIVAPLNETVGLIYLDSRIDVADLSGGNRELLEALALEASTVLENARLLDEERARQRLEEELRIARSIQQSLLPRQLPETGWFRAAGASLASQQVGGDYFDVAEHSSGDWSVVVADVSGKGVSAALLASLLQGAFLIGASTPEAMERMFARINAYLYGRTEGEKYATLFYCSVRRDGSACWVNAGHCPPALLHRDGSLESLPSTSMPVGMLDTATFKAASSQLRSGDKLVIFSDGVTEARNAAGKLFDQSSVMSLLPAGAAMSAAELHAHVLEAVSDFTGGAPQRDDMTLVVAEYNPENG